MFFFDRLEGKRNGCFLGEPTRWRPVLPVPVPPRRPAVRRPVPTRPWYVRVWDSTGVHLARDLGSVLLPVVGPQGDGEARQVQAHAVEERGRHGDGALAGDRD